MKLELQDVTSVKGVIAMIFVIFGVLVFLLFGGGSGVLSNADVELLVRLLLLALVVAIIYFLSNR